MPDPLELRVDIEALEDFFGEQRDIVAEMMAERIDAVTAMFAERLSDNLLGQILQKRTGNLLSTVATTPAATTSDTVEGSAQAGGDAAPYGAMLNVGGERWYQIVPKNADFLRFIGADGKAIFAKIVNHPPVPYLPWFDRAIQDGTDEAEELLEGGF